MLIIDMPKKYLTDASGCVSCAMCQKYLPLLYRDCHNDFKGCLIKGELPEEHGDLIDRDVASEAFTRAFDELDRDVAVFSANGVVGVLKSQQAVIEAERKDDGIKQI